MFTLGLYGVHSTEAQSPPIDYYKTPSPAFCTNNTAPATLKKVKDGRVVCTIAVTVSEALKGYQFVEADKIIVTKLNNVEILCYNAKHGCKSCGIFSEGEKFKATIRQTIGKVVRVTEHYFIFSIKNLNSKKEFVIPLDIVNGLIIFKNEDSPQEHDTPQ